MYLGKLEHGKVIRRLRMERQLSIEDVAELIDEDVKFIQELEEEMYPDITIGIYYRLAKVFEMEPHELVKEISLENIDYVNRILTYRRSRYKEIKQRDTQRKLVLQKKITHNFKNKRTKLHFKNKIITTNNRPTTLIKELNKVYEIF
ncbi:transcriptional regulator with XRE-family HTH domain [Neobacillus niacini]|uniref:helix-turn-helix domain-containing protein n=1 Tax=Neobacillus niacini TaxID=86668 RepID=UPI00104D9674|nr:helix-turn-helix transcriptional regulator [Neobacillus niacini]MDR7078891.1 transcriptional regulator with XRE-family HTH domain [Neobacillus niacini]